MRRRKGNRMRRHSQAAARARKSHSHSQTIFSTKKKDARRDERMSRAAAPLVGPWQRQLNELGGVKPLAFG
jgi:hypothetical protein